MEPTTRSILLTIKKMLGIAEEYHAFDIDIITHINSVFLSLDQLGVGPEEAFRIEGNTETWEDFLGGKSMPGVETYVYLKTRLLFDPPTNSFLVEAMQNQANELEWRMNLQSERRDTIDGDEVEGAGTDRRARRSLAPWYQGDEVGST